MGITAKHLGRFAVVAASAVIGYLLVGALVHADAAPLITTQIKDSSDATVTSALVGASVRDAVQVASSTNQTVPQGTVDFNVYNNTTCDGTAAVQNQQALVNGFATSSAQIVGASGLSFKAHYNGDNANIAADGACEPLTPTSNNSSIATNLSATSVTAGASVHDTATLSNVTGNAGGTVTYTVYSDNACQTPFAGAGNKAVTNGTVQNSDDIVFNNVGSYFWQVVYHGDANNSIATSTCNVAAENLTVQAAAKNSPTASTNLSSTNITAGSSVNDTATLSGATASAGGSGDYTVYSDNACQTLFGNAGHVTVTNTAVPNSPPFQFNSAGTFYWQFVYHGDANNNPATSTCNVAAETVTVQAAQGKNSPTIATTLSTTSSTIIVGNPVHDSAALTGATANAGGLVTYKVFNDSVCSVPFANLGSKPVTNTAVVDSDPITINTAGTYYFQAVYGGDANNNIATSTCTSEVLTVVAAPSPNPTPGANNTLSGTVYNDLNKNGVKDSGEGGLAGFTINLYNSANFNHRKYDPVFKTAVTDASGNYSFTGLSDGTYSIEQLKKTGWKQNSDDFKSVVIAGNAGKAGLDFADVQKKKDNGKDNNKHKKDCTNEESDNDDNDNASSSKHWINLNLNLHDNGLHFGWFNGKGNQGKDKHEN